jgi:V-type H+-transporting ATPase subunit H
MQKVSKEATLQYTVTLIDDLLQENKMRVDLFHQYGRKYRDNVYHSFIKMLYLQDIFLINQASRIITKLACWSSELIPDKELKDYILWIKEQIEEKVRQLRCIK